MYKWVETQNVTRKFKVKTVKELLWYALVAAVLNMYKEVRRSHYSVRADKMLTAEP